MLTDKTDDWLAQLGWQDLVHEELLRREDRDDVTDRMAGGQEKLGEAAGSDDPAAPSLR
jgi:hypothetical protein